MVWYLVKKRGNLNFIFKENDRLGKETAVTYFTVNGKGKGKVVPVLN
jgi:hypothetical protein